MLILKTRHGADVCCYTPPPYARNANLIRKSCALFTPPLLRMQLLENLTLQRDEVRESHRAMLQKHHQRFHHTCACLGSAK